MQGCASGSGVFERSSAVERPGAAFGGAWAMATGARLLVHVPMSPFGPDASIRKWPSESCLQGLGKRRVWTSATWQQATANGRACSPRPGATISWLGGLQGSRRIWKTTARCELRHLIDDAQVHGAAVALSSILGLDSLSAFYDGSPHEAQRPNVVCEINQDQTICTDWDGLQLARAAVTLTSGGAAYLHLAGPLTDGWIAPHARCTFVH
ncbi:hypothetical protein VTI28DRAFT_375 [Corynascus sepedonium]